MNLLDAAILLVLALSSIIAAYRGFVVSVLDLVSFFASWLSAIFFSPMLSRYIVERWPQVLQTLISFSEGAFRIDSVEDRLLPVASLSAERIAQLVNDANLPYPFDRLLLSNLMDLALQDIRTLAEYFNHSIANILLNIITFVGLYITVRILFSLLISIVRGIVGLPVLKSLDWLLGLCFGFIRGIFIVNLFFLLLSVVLILIPVDLLMTLADNSVFAEFFTRYNLFSLFLSGKI